MIKYTVKFDCLIDGKQGHFISDHDTPTSIAKEMCYQYLKYIGHIEDQAKLQEEKNKENKDTNQEVNPNG